MIIPVDHGNLVTTWTVTGNAEPKSFNMGYYDGSANGATNHANRWFDILDANLQTAIANEVTIQSVTAYFNEGGALTIGVSDRPAFNGTFAAGAASPNVATLTRKNTGLAGRKFRGRAFLPPVPDNYIDSGGNVSAPAQTQVNNGLAACLAAADDTGLFGWAMPLRLLHSDATPPTDIISWVCDPKVGTQRRRMR